MKWSSYPDTAPVESQPSNKRFYYVKLKGVDGTAYKCWYRGGSWLCDSLNTVLVDVTHFSPAKRNDKTQIEIDSDTQK